MTDQGYQVEVTIKRTFEIKFSREIEAPGYLILLIVDAYDDGSARKGIAHLVKHDHKEEWVIEGCLVDHEEIEQVTYEIMETAFHLN